MVVEDALYKAGNILRVRHCKDIVARTGDSRAFRRDADIPDVVGDAGRDIWEAVIVHEDADGKARIFEARVAQDIGRVSRVGGGRVRRPARTKLRDLVSL